MPINRRPDLIALTTWPGAVAGRAPRSQPPHANGGAGLSRRSVTASGADRCVGRLRPLRQLRILHATARLGQKQRMSWSHRAVHGGMGDPSPRSESGKRTHAGLSPSREGRQSQPKAQRPQSQSSRLLRTAALRRRGRRRTKQSQPTSLVVDGSGTLETSVQQREQHSQVGRQASGPSWWVVEPG